MRHGLLRAHDLTMQDHASLLKIPHTLLTIPHTLLTIPHHLPPATGFICQTPDS